MNTIKYDEYVKQQENKMDNYKCGYSIDDFKKGETVYVFIQNCPTAVPVLTKGKINKLVKAKNAEGKDKIRQVEIDMGSFIFNACTVKQIAAFVFKRIEAPKKEEQVQEAPETKVEGSEIMTVEKAMTAKNKNVKKYIQQGWVFISSEWNSAKNMYVATLAR